ncbi:MAG: hypothetical protein M1514_04145, partial [Patescibacteria group bacterium]|nr:hypothetical protein [Patescibacteria group bacterium]
VSFLRGESVTLDFVPGGGRKRTLQYLAENAGQFGFSKLGKYKIVFIDYDQLRAGSEDAYFDLMLSALGQDSDGQQSFLVLTKAVSSLISQGWHLIFLLGRFDDLQFSKFFFNNLKTLWEIDKKKIHFIFAVNRDIFFSDFYRYDRLKELTALVKTKND